MAEVLPHVLQELLWLCSQPAVDGAVAKADGLSGLVGAVTLLEEYRDPLSFDVVQFAMLLVSGGAETFVSLSCDANVVTGCCTGRTTLELPVDTARVETQDTSTGTSPKSRR